MAAYYVITYAILKTLHKALRALVRVPKPFLGTSAIVIRR